MTNETCGCSGMSGTTTYGYNDAGEQTSMRDPSGNVTSYTYDGQGRELTETAPAPISGVTSYAYDSAGNLTSEKDSDGNTTTYAYDAANERTSTTEPQAPSNPATYAYDAAGELTSATDPDGRTITYAYDKAGKETAQTWVGGSYTATYNYDKDGELTSVSDPNSTYSYTYNALGQQTSVSNAGTPGGVPTVTLSSSYDSFGNRTGLADSLGGSIRYAYNRDNEMTSLGLTLSTTLDAQVTIAYDAAGNMTGMTRTAPSATSPHTIGTSFSYNHSNEVTNITATDTTASVTLASYTYGYNPAGILTSYQDNSGNSLTYGYDANTELTSATGTLAGSSYTYTYNYDHNGNRTSTTTDVNGTLTSATYTLVTGSNELQNDGTYSYTYDNNGNMLTQTNLQTSSVTTYTWDFENRLTEVRTGTSDEKFTYDVFGNRIGVSLNGTQQLYTVYDGSNPYTDFNGSGTLTERYLTNPNSLNQFYGQVNGSGTPQWFVTDYLGSVRQVVSTSGSVLDAIVYDPYGSIVTQSNAADAPSFLFDGGEYDSIAGQYRFGARWYEPTDGRFESQDPLGLSAEQNLYLFAYNDPTDYYDKNGLIGIFFDGAGQSWGAGTTLQELAQHDFDPGGVHWFQTPLSLPDRVHSEVEEAYDIVIQTVRKAEEAGCKEPVDIFGWSRGGMAAIALAWKLSGTMGLQDKRVTVRFLGLIDPVSRATIWGFTENKIPANVRDVFEALKKKQESFFKDIGPVFAASPAATKIRVKRYLVTHALSGFDTTPGGLAIKRDLAAAAVAVGVPIDLSKMPSDPTIHPLSAWLPR